MIRPRNTNEIQVDKQNEPASQSQNIDEEQDDPDLAELNVINESEVMDMSLKDQLGYVVKSVPVLYKMAKRAEATSKTTGNLRNDVRKMIDVQTKLLEEVRSLRESVTELKEVRKELNGKSVFEERIIPRNSEPTRNPMHKMPFQTWEAAEEFFQADNPEFVSVRSSLEQR